MKKQLQTYAQQRVKDKMTTRTRLKGLKIPETLKYWVGVQ